MASKLQSNLKGVIITPSSIETQSSIAIKALFYRYALNNITPRQLDITTQNTPTLPLDC